MRGTKILHSEKGFSLTELMVAIVLMGILSMIAIPKFMGTTTKAKLAEFPAILMQIYSLQESYNLETDRYATSLKDLDFTDPDSRYFTYSLEGDGKSYIAKATVRENIKDGQGNDIKGEFATINHKKEHSGSENLRRISKW